MNHLQSILNSPEIRKLNTKIKKVHELINSHHYYGKNEDKLIIHWLYTGISNNCQDIMLMSMGLVSRENAITTLTKFIEEYDIDIKYSIELIGKGGSGFVYRPPICDNMLYHDNKYVMKITYDDDGENEMKNADILRKIDPEQRYFLYCITKCNPNYQFISDEYTRLSDDFDYVGLICYYGGIPMNASSLKGILMEIYLKLIRICYILQKNKIIHKDLNQGNILIEGNDVKIIDFASSMIDNYEQRLSEDFDDMCNLEKFICVYRPLFYTIYFHEDVGLDHYYKTYERDLLYFNPKYVKNGEGDLIAKWSKLSKEQILKTLILPNIFKYDIYCVSKLILFYGQCIINNSDDRKLLYKIANLCTDLDIDTQYDSISIMEYVDNEEKLIRYLFLPHLNEKLYSIIEIFL